MLSKSKLVGFVATTRPSEAKQFYGATLGLQLIEEGPYALVFAAHGTTLRVQKVEAFVKVPYTTLGWAVADIVATLEWLAKRGVQPERFQGMPQDDLGIWRTPDGSKVAWLRDPDGNTLSITEHRAG